MKKLRTLEFWLMVGLCVFAVGYILLSHVFAIFPVALLAQSSSSCYDSDGDSPTTASSVIAKDDKGLWATFYDLCVDEKTVGEYVCENGKAVQKPFVCSGTCFNAICTGESAVSSSASSAASGTGAAASTSSVSQSGSFVGGIGQPAATPPPAAAQSSSAQTIFEAVDTFSAPPPPPQSGCFDSDGGDVPEVAGKTSLIDNGQERASWSDTCAGERLAEYICDAGNVKSVLHTCSTGCISNACRSNQNLSPGFTSPPAAPTQIPTSPVASSTQPGIHYSAPAVFPDVNSETLEGVAAYTLSQKGIISGYPDGTFKGGQPVNRAEAAKFLLLSKYGFVPDVQNNGRFPDVIDGQWYARFVTYAASLKIIDGNPDGTFRPANTVNTAEFLKMISNTFGLQTGGGHSYSDVPVGSWYAPYAGVASQYNLFPERPATLLLPGQPLTRKEVAIAIYTILEQLE